LGRGRGGEKGSGREKREGERGEGGRTFDADAEVAVFVVAGFCEVVSLKRRVGVGREGSYHLR